MSTDEQFAAETAIGLIKPFHRVECRCEQCVAWLQIEFCKQQAEVERLENLVRDVRIRLHSELLQGLHPSSYSKGSILHR
jgi:hypothetical protein